MLNSLRRTLDWLPVGSVPEISPGALRDRIDAAEAIQLLDVRSAVEFNTGHIEGAALLPITRFRREIQELVLDAERPVIAICRTAHRSIPAVRWLRRAGFDAVQLRGGMLAWTRAGLPTVRPEVRQASEDELAL